MKCFPGGSHSKESTCSARDTGLIPGLGKSPGEGNGCPLQYSCPENPMDRRDWLAIVIEMQKGGPARVANTFTLFFFFSSSMIRICSKPGLSRWRSGKESICQCRRQVDKNSIPGLERSPGKAMATYSSILALKIPWTEEPGGL